MRLVRIAVLTATLTPGLALAQDDYYDDAEPQHEFSLTWSPIHALLPIIELTGELRLDDDLGVAGILGAGRPGGFTGIEAGGQFRWYAVGSFVHGMQLGAEVLWVHVGNDAEGGIAASASGVAIGPFIGYKIATSIGFTFDAQLGFEYYAVQAEAEDTTGGQTATAEQKSTIPLLNLNVGWSF